MNFVDPRSLEQFKTAMDKIVAISGKTMREALQQQAGLAARDAMKVTPPFGDHSVKEPYGKQKRVGWKAVEHDIDLVFRPVDDYRLVRDEWHYRHGDLGQRIRKALKKNDFVLAEWLLKTAGLKPLAVIAEATEQLHKDKFDKNFRVRGRKYAVKNKASIGRLKLMLQRRVGIAKAGWLHAFEKYGRDLGDVKKWIADKRALARGMAFDSTERDNPAVTISNDVPYVQQVADDLIPLVMSLRMKAVKSNAKALEKWAAKKASEAAGVQAISTA